MVMLKQKIQKIHKSKQPFCMRTAYMCTIAQYVYGNLSSHPPDNYHCLSLDYWKQSAIIWTI